MAPFRCKDAARNWLPRCAAGFGKNTTRKSANKGESQMNKGRDRMV
jgi:hypothetical protein